MYEVRSKTAELEASLKKAADTRTEKLQTLTASLKPGDEVGHAQLMSEVKTHNAASAAVGELLKEIRSEEDALRSVKDPSLIAARAAQTASAATIEPSRERISLPN